MIPVTIRLISIVITVSFLFAACDRDLKEHPMPASLKRQLEMQDDPEVQRKKVSGTITLGAKAAETLPPNATLFIFARPEGQQSGPPLAVKRLSGIHFPFQYRIGQMDTMLEGANFDGVVHIFARLSRSGTAKAGAGDVQGSATAQVGNDHVDIMLDHVLTAGEVKSGGAGPFASSAPDASVSRTISGTITVAPEFQKQATKNGFLFIYVRPEGVHSGPPLAAKRFEAVSFPYEFSISEKDAMVPGTRFGGRVILTARLDQDGDARSAPGDIEGDMSTQPGQKNVALILNRGIGPKKETGQAPGSEASKTLSGTISIDPQIAKEVPDNLRMFIVLRYKDASGAPPMAVQLHSEAKFPFDYTISQTDAMMPGTVVEGDVEVIVRIDRDGNAKSSPGDLEGKAFGAVGDQDVNIVLDKKV